MVNVTDEAAAQAGLSELVREVWHASPDADLAVVAGLSAEERLIVEVRLKALLSVERGERAAFSALDDGGRALTPAGFQALVSRWRKSRHVSTLIPYATRKPRGRAARHDDSVVTDTAQELVQAELHQSIETLARRLMFACPQVRSLNTAKTLVREARAVVRLWPDNLRANYGAAVVIDQSAVEVRLDGGAPVMIVAMLAVETASGLILAHSTGRNAPLDPQIGEVGVEVAGFLAQHQADRAAPPSCHLMAVIGVGPDSDVEAIATSMRSRGATVVDSVRRMVGDRVALLLDGQVGGLRLRPRSTAAVLLEQGEGHDDDYHDAEAEFARAVDRHNGPILDCLREAGLIAPAGGVPSGAMADAVNDIPGPSLAAGDRGHAG